MTANPILDRIPQGGGRITEGQLQAYAAELNRKPFVEAMGWNYFVAKGQDGSHRLERKG